MKKPCCARTLPWPAQVWQRLVRVPGLAPDPSQVSQRAATSTSISRVQPEKASSSLNRSEEHTSELQSLMRISYAVFCLKKKNQNSNIHTAHHKPKRNLINNKNTRP